MTQNTGERGPERAARTHNLEDLIQWHEQNAHAPVLKAWTGTGKLIVTSNEVSYHGGRMPFF